MISNIFSCHNWSPNFYKNIFLWTIKTTIISPVLPIPQSLGENNKSTPQKIICISGLYPQKHQPSNPQGTIDHIFIILQNCHTTMESKCDHDTKETPGTHCIVAIILSFLQSHMMSHNQVSLPNHPEGYIIFHTSVLMEPRSKSQFMLLSTPTVHPTTILSNSFKPGIGFKNG